MRRYPLELAARTRILPLYVCGVGRRLKPAPPRYYRRNHTGTWDGWQMPPIQ